MRLSWKAVLPAIVLCGLMSSSPAFAARDFTPQAGLWVIPSEVDGKPGRGFSLDVQGNTAFMQVFSYEKNGAATFHTALGKLDDSASMTVPLLRFKGGRYLGGPAQDAVADGSVGNVTIKFTDGLNGTVQFPGEQEQPVARFLVPEKLPLWWTQLTQSPPEGGREGQQIMRWTATAADGTHHAWGVRLSIEENNRMTLGLGALLDGDAMGGVFNCQLQADTQVFDCTPNGSADAATIQRIRFRVVGRDVVGQIQPADAPDQRMSINGWQEGSFYCDADWCNYPDKRSARVYVNSSFLDGICITGMCSGYGNLTLVPTSGAWMVEEEKTGRPGRGVFLDVQDNTIIVQTSDYLANGEPTFHMGASTLQGSIKSDAGDTTASMPLVRYAGGRSFGGPARSGTEVANAGSLQLSFTPRESNKFNDFASGSISLPGESPKALRRLNLDPTPDNGLEQFLGEYVMSWRFAMSSRSRLWVQLTQVKDVFVMNEDGTVRCYRNARVPPSPTTLTCALITTSNNQQNWTGVSEIDVQPFHRDSSHIDLAMRTRDRHGNWLGLGAVNLPGLAIPAK